MMFIELQNRHLKISMLNLMMSKKKISEKATINGEIKLKMVLRTSLTRMEQ